MRRKTTPDDSAFAAMTGSFPDISMQEGLTKREFFAAMAMIGTEASNPDQINADCTMDPLSSQEVAERAVRMADALIKELNKETK